MVAPPAEASWPRIQISGKTSSATLVPLVLRSCFCNFAELIWLRLQRHSCRNVRSHSSLGNLCEHSAAKFRAVAIRAVGFQKPEEAIEHGAFARLDVDHHCSCASACRNGTAEAFRWCEWKSGCSKGEDHESARPPIDLMPELPLIYELETNTLQSRIQSRPNWIPIAWNASKGRLHAVPHKSHLQKRKQDLRGLPR